MLENYFHLKENHTDVKTEVMAGLTTFFAMSYIIFVNPDLLATGADIVNAGSYQQVYNGVFFATCIAACIGTLLMGLYAKIPFAQAPGMGLNAFFAFTVMAGFGYGYSQTLGIVLISGLLFIAITAFGLREAIVDAIPVNVKTAISAGIGLFLAFLGLKTAGIVVDNPATFVSLVDFSQINTAEGRPAIMGALVAIIGLFLIAALYKMRVKGSILIGIIVCTIIGIPMGVTHLPESFSINFGGQFKDFLDVSLFSCFSGLGSIFEGKNLLDAIFTIIMLVLSFSMVDMFDTIGTLLGTAKKANLLDKDGNMPNMKKALMCDAVATTTGAMLGTSTVTTFVESSAGIGEGGRTGLTSVVTGLMFIAAMVLAPFVGIIPSAATAPALIFVGALMISSIKELEWDDMSVAIPSFLTIIMMPLTYSISNGIAFGLLSHVIIKAACGKFKEIKPFTVVLAVLFIIRFFTIAM